MPTLTKNSLLMDVQPSPDGNGNRIRTLADPQSNEIVSQQEIPPKTGLRSKAAQRRRKF